MREIVLMAPMQIKQQLGIGNIYDLVLCDFYAKARRITGVKVIFPMLINVNGTPIEKIFGPNPQEADISITVDNLTNMCKKYKINFDYVLRDDNNPILNQSVNASFKNVLVNECLACGSIFGTDPDIKRCKNCGEITTYHMRDALVQSVFHSEILQKLESVNFFPNSVKTRLYDFIQSLPAQYELLLEKPRAYTSIFNGTPLDPRFTAIALLDQVVRTEKEYDLLTCISGDLVKKYVYFIFAYLDISPTNIVIHGLATGENNKKIRWQDEKGTNFLDYLEIDEQELRTFFITNSPLKNITISKKTTRDNAIRMNRLKKKFLKVFHLQADGRTDAVDRERLGVLSASFDCSISSWRFAQAVKNTEDFVEESLHILETGESLSSNELSRAKNLYSLYF